MLVSVSVGKRNQKIRGLTGYDKIRFCGEQARHGLQYFWIDTCCIDKSSSTELSTPCFAGSSFRKSKWFTRGWTLQELVAPVSRSLERHIHEVTGIPVKALRGSSPSNFDFSAYSLLGIFDVYMPLIYGEGRENTLKRLRVKIDKASKGTKREDFSVAFSLSDIPEIEHFVAREEIHRTLRGDGSRRAVVLHGLEGIGKTQLAIAYAKPHRDNYSAVFWLNTKDEDSPKQSFAKAAKRILREHPSASRLSSVDIKEKFDEAIDANHIIITTRSSEVKIGHRIRIRKLEDVCHSLKILSTTSRREGLIDDPEAVKVAKKLDGLPLALVTAGAYLDQLSFDHVKQRNELSAKLLRLCDSEDPEWICELTKDELSFNEAVRVLNMSSQEWIESRGYSIHGCVHSWTWDYDLVKLALKFVGSHVPTEESGKWWLTQRRLLQHAARCSHAVLNCMVQLPDDRRKWALHMLGVLYANQGKLDEAEKMYRRALQGKEKTWGPDHTSTLATVSNLGRTRASWMRPRRYPMQGK
ncbi:P-loop containing nucleoside triphosphate hydrolase protein [Elaphomyces granulatus]